MKRSRINDIMAAADDLIRHHGFVLPPFAYWTPGEFKARKAQAGSIISARMGWDITDYGQGGPTGPLPHPCRQGRGYHQPRRRDAGGQAERIEP